MPVTILINNLLNDHKLACAMVARTVYIPLASGGTSVRESQSLRKLCGLKNRANDYEPQ
jgi:hypothetical protein